nr:hypothetical protein [Marasmiellus scandens]
MLDPKLYLGPIKKKSSLKHRQPLFRLRISAYLQVRRHAPFLLSRSWLPDTILLHFIWSIFSSWGKPSQTPKLANTKIRCTTILCLLLYFFLRLLRSLLRLRSSAKIPLLSCLLDYIRVKYLF